MMGVGMVRGEVAYARPDKQKILPVVVPAGTSLYDAVQQSGMLQVFPGIDLDGSDLGIFGKVVKDAREQVLQDGDRIEIYRPLKIDPKQARLNRAKKSRD